MHSDPMDDLFANLSPDSPLADEMEALLREGLAVETAELEAATDDVIQRVQPPSNRWPAFGALGLLAAAALLGIAVWNADEPQILPVEDHAGVVDYPPLAADVVEPLAPEVAAEIADRVDAAATAIGDGNYRMGLLIFNQLLEEGNLTELQLRKLTVTLHGAARKAENEEQTLVLEQTVAGYETWLERFPESDHASDMNYAFAELLYKTQRYDEAFDHYMTVATKYPESKHAAFCAESAIFAAENVMKLQQADGSWDGSEAPGLNRTETQLMAAVDAALAADPDGPKAGNIQYKGAYVLYNSGEFPDARDRFEAVIDADPSTKLAEQAASLIADSFVVTEDWADLEASTLRFSEDLELGDEAFQAEMLSIAGRAAMKQLEDPALTADEVADGWCAVFEKYGDVEDARDKAADALRSAGRDAEADALYE